MYGAGLRLSELVGLDIKHLDLDTGEVWVMGKGSKERRLPIGRNAVTWIEHWLDCAACSPATKRRYSCQSSASVSPRAMSKNGSPNGA